METQNSTKELNALLSSLCGKIAKYFLFTFNTKNSDYSNKCQKIKAEAQKSKQFNTKRKIKKKTLNCLKNISSKLQKCFEANFWFDFVGKKIQKINKSINMQQNYKTDLPMKANFLFFLLPINLHKHLKTLLLLMIIAGQHHISTISFMLNSFC